VNEFEIGVHESSGSITGEFRRLRPFPGLVRPLENGKRFGKRACFDVKTEEGDMRWCIQARGEQLSGTWSNGPEGGALLNGAGEGARIFSITGKRQSRETKTTP
jgi:hypothetical protein